MIYAEKSTRRVSAAQKAAELDQRGRGVCARNPVCGKRIIPPRIDKDGTLESGATGAAKRIDFKGCQGYPANGSAGSHDPQPIPHTLRAGAGGNVYSFSARFDRAGSSTDICELYVVCSRGSNGKSRIGYGKLICGRHRGGNYCQLIPRGACPYANIAVF